SRAQMGCVEQEEPDLLRCRCAPSTFGTSSTGTASTRRTCSTASTLDQDQRLDLLRGAVLHELEIIAAEIGHEPVVLRHANVHFDDLRARSKRRRRRRLLLRYG